MKKNWNKPPWFSSYQENNYGELFYALMRIYQPKKVVELGTKAGFSAFHMARGLKQNGKGKLFCYDLWEKYEFNSVPQSVAQENLKLYPDIVSLISHNAVGVEKIHKSIDILHIDLGNSGEILEKIVPFWIDKVNQLIIIEGGSEERDRVYWMSKFNKIPITTWLKHFKQKRKEINYFTFKPFPSITLLYKTHF